MTDNSKPAIEKFPRNHKFTICDRIQIAAARSLDETGRLIGAWIKAYATSNAAVAGSNAASALPPGWVAASSLAMRAATCAGW
jgi:hypothetical protein